MANKVPLDLSQFKHLKSDKYTTTLKHPAGHQITLAHAALHPDTQKQLAALSKQSQDAETVEDSEELKKKMADGGEINDHLRNQSNEKLEQSKKESPENKLDYKELKKEYVEKNKTHFIQGRKRFDEGGRVPVPAGQGTPNNDQEKQQRAKAISDVERTSTSNTAIPSDSPLKTGKWNIWAEGGEVPHEHDETCQACGGPMRKAYANPQEPVSQDDSAPQIPNIPQDLIGTKTLPPPELPQDYNAISSAIDNTKNWLAAPAGQEVAESPISPKDVAVAKAERTASSLDAKSDQATAIADTLKDNQSEQPQLQQPQAAASPDQMPAQAQGPEGMIAQGYNQEAAGIAGKQSAEQGLAKSQAATLQSNVESQMAAQKAFTDNVAELNKERQAHIDDIKAGYVNPEKYWENHSKLAAGIGMILAGFNPASGGKNYGVDFINNQINRSVDAQAKNLSAKDNLLRANLEQFHNIRDAADMTRLMQADIVSHKLQMDAANAANPMAKANAQMALGELNKTYAPIFQQFAMRRAMMNLADQGGNPNAVEHMLGYMRVMNPEMAKEMETRYVPGVGLAPVPVPPDVRGRMVGHQQADAAIADLQNYLHQHTNLNPLSKEYAVGKQKALELQAKVRESLLNTVYREGEQPLLDKLVKANPAGVMKYIAEGQLKELRDTNTRDFNVLKQQYSLPATQQQAAPQYKTVNGVKYMRGPHGEAIPVNGAR